MKFRSILILIFLYLFFDPFYCEADTLVFKNGDRLSGTFEHVIDRKVIFNSEIAGELSIDIFQIKEINTNDERLMEIELEDGYVLGDKIYKSKDYGEVNTVCNINKPAVQNKGFSGSISGSFSSQHGNTFTEYLQVSADVTWRSVLQRVMLDGYYFYGRDENDDGEKYASTDRFFVRGEYNFFFREKDFVYGRASFQRNAIDDLDYRIISGIGIGRQWFNSSKFKLSTSSGIAYLKEKYSTTVLLYDVELDEYYKEEIIEEEGMLASQAGVRLDWKMHKKVDLISRLNLTTAFSDYSDYVMNSDTELRLSITKSFFTNFKVMFNYDSTPGHEIEESEIRYLIGIGWRF